MPWWMTRIFSGGRFKMRTASLRVASDTAIRASARLRIRSAKSLSAATFDGECVSGSSQQVRSCTVAVSFARRGGFSSLQVWKRSTSGSHPSDDIVGKPVEQEQHPQAHPGGDGVRHGAFVVQPGASSRKGKSRMSKQRACRRTGFLA